jgi:protease-4
MVLLQNEFQSHQRRQFVEHAKKLISIFFICSLLPILANAEPPKVRTHLPVNSVAMSDDALATFFNPAGLGTNRALNLYYLRTYRSDLPGDDALFISAPNGGFSVEFANASENIDFTRYSLSAGHHFGNALFWGTSYSWINSDNRFYDRYNSLSIGLMYRRRYFSIGAIARDLNRPSLFNQKLGRTYDLGIALRPGTWRTTFSIDMQKTQDVSEIDLSYAVEIRPIRELMLRGAYNSDQSFDIRFGINIGNIGIGTANCFDENRKTNTGVGYFHFSTASITKPIPRKRLFLDSGIQQLDTILRIAKWDEDVAGILIRINGSEYGMGQFQEIRDAIMEFRESGRVVMCYITDCSTGDYIVASACDQILIHPSAGVRLIGLRSERSFYKGALDKLGIRAHLEHIGEYKSASETFTRSNMSDPHRENQNAILDDLYDQLTTDIATARGWTPEYVKQLIDQGPFTANQARKLKIVDELIYTDGLDHRANKLAESKVTLVNVNEYLNSGLYPHDWTVPKPKIAIIKAEGMMLTGESFTDPFTGTKVMGAETIARTIRYTRQNESIKAVVLRIDSGGGLVIAADIIWNELIMLTLAKPLIVSMADVAASGGYYIAAPADVIVAEPGTITGSIGVIGGKYSFKGLYEKLGIKKEIITRGEHADFYSNYSDYSHDEQVIVQKQIDEIYQDFTSKVARGRAQLTKEEVEKVARGRVWTGRQAKEKGLVDELGGLSKALSIAKKRAGLDNKVVEIVRLPKLPWITQLLGNIQLIFNKSTFQMLGNYQSFGHELFGETPGLKLLDIIKKHRIFLLMPYEINVGS